MDRIGDNVKTMRGSKKGRPVILRTLDDYVSLIRFEASMDSRSTSQLAKDADVCHGTLARHLAGDTTRPGFKTVLKILKVFGYRVRAEKG